MFCLQIVYLPAASCGAVLFTLYEQHIVVYKICKNKQVMSLFCVHIYVCAFKFSNGEVPYLHIHGLLLLSRKRTNVIWLYYLVW